MVGFYFQNKISSGTRWCLWQWLLQLEHVEAKAKRRSPCVIKSRSDFSSFWKEDLNHLIKVNLRFLMLVVFFSFLICYEFLSLKDLGVEGEGGFNSSIVDSFSKNTEMNLTGTLSYELDTFWGILVCIPPTLKVQKKKKNIQIMKRAYRKMCRVWISYLHLTFQSYLFPC